MAAQRLARARQRLHGLRRVGLTLLVPVIMLFQLPARSAAAEKIRLAVSNPNMSFMTAAVALKKGFFQEEGLDAEIIQMRVPVMITALATGDIDYTMVFGSVVRAAIRGLPVRVVASLLDGSAHALIARPELKSVKELRGKTLAVESYGASSDVIARMMIKHFGIDPEKEMRVVALGADRARLAALKEGLVDVAVISPPADTAGKRAGFNLLARAYELFRFPFVGLGANARKIQEKPDEVKRTIRALIKANRYIRENREGVTDILVAWGRVSRDDALASYDSTWRIFSPDGTIPEDGLRLVIDQSKTELKINRHVALGEVADLTILKEAQWDLRIRGR